MTWVPGSASVALVQGLAPGVLGADLSVFHLLSPSCSMLSARVVCFRGPCPSRRGRGTSSYRPPCCCDSGLTLGAGSAASHRLLCPLAETKHPAHTGRTWPGRPSWERGGLQKPPPRGPWAAGVTVPKPSKSAVVQESLWVGGGHPVSLRPGASTWTPEGGAGRWEAGRSPPGRPP